MGPESAKNQWKKSVYHFERFLIWEAEFLETPATERIHVRNWSFVGAAFCTSFSLHDPCWEILTSQHHKGNSLCLYMLFAIGDTLSTGSSIRPPETSKSITPMQDSALDYFVDSRSKLKMMTNMRSFDLNIAWEIGAGMFILL